MTRKTLPLLLLCCLALPAGAAVKTLSSQLSALQNALILPLNNWRFHQPDVPGYEAAHFNYSAWPLVHPGFQWGGPNTKCWFRSRFVVPATVAGISTRGASLSLLAGIDDYGEIYVNGMLQQTFHWDDGAMTLARHAVPGTAYQLALRGINTIGTGQLHFVNVRISIPQLDQLQQETAFYTTLLPSLSPKHAAEVRAALNRCAQTLRLSQRAGLSTTAFVQRLQKAHLALMPLRSMVRSYEVDYVGHAHIDMNWLWPWPETVQVCRDTWRSVMHLMNLFPDFGYVQSQPGAYAAIQKRYPREFAAMQAAAKRGQWEPVGGLWNESDTDMPSGEGLARSFLLGQTYFKKYFGHIATVGWLPDSFGHSWQMPQLMRLSGINSYYHMRCEEEFPLMWWQSPDGSRVLTAHTEAYDEPVVLNQLVRPWNNQRRDGIRRALVVFGVGDHGGGPTRQQILQGKAYQSDPLLPRVRFCTASTFFHILRSNPQTKHLPVFNHDLQYVFTGAYTTHADLKKAVRRNQNDLYAAEVFSSLNTLQGAHYPVQGFDTAWKPTAFAQFHDIMAGTAIHSTYTWMEKRLAPADKWAVQQRSSALQALTSKLKVPACPAADLPVAVWNALSWPRTDMVRVQVSNPARYHSVRDAQGARTAVQQDGRHTLVFVAQNVPAFGSRVYYLSPAAAPAQTPLLIHSSGKLILQNSALQASVNPKTGLLLSLIYRKTGQEVLQQGKPQNVLQLLGDAGNAWDINYTGAKVLLTTQGAQVRVTADGPVFAQISVTHQLGASTYTQNLTLAHHMSCLLVPSVVDWHEHGQFLKVAFHLAMQRPHLHVSIPYGSIARPDNGQENPGQSWMDMTDKLTPRIQNAHPVSLAALYNNSSAVNFDGENRGYVRSDFPAPGVQPVGPKGIPMLLHGSKPGKDNVECLGQTIQVSPTRGGMLALLGASAPGTHGGRLLLHFKGGSVKSAALVFNDWVFGSTATNTTWLRFPARMSQGKTSAVATHLWGFTVPLPANRTLVAVTLPSSPHMHLFAATLAHIQPGRPLFGLTVLNNCKYGSDARGARFRLSLLRSTNSPDPTPDEGMERFTYALQPHTGGWQAAKTEQAGKSLNVPLYAVVTKPHTRKAVLPVCTLHSSHHDLVAEALKGSENGKGMILRFFETQGVNTRAVLTFSKPVTVQQTDLLERPLPGTHPMHGKQIVFPVGHDKIVTLRITGWKQRQ